MTKTDIALSITLISLSTLYLLLCSISIINTQPGNLYKYSNIENPNSSSQVYNDPKPLNILEEIANTFKIPVRTLSLTITLLISLTWGLFFYTSTANVALSSIMTLGVFLMAKIFLGV